MNKINQAFIMAAGRGERMRPLTATIPKPLAKIKGRAMVDYILEKVNAISQIEKIVVNTYYLAEILEAHLNSLNNPKIIVSHENEVLETGGGIINALPLFDLSRPILIINCDLFWIDKNNELLNSLIKNFDETNMDALLALKPKDKFFGYSGDGDFDLDNNNNLTRKNVASHTYIGAGIVHPRVLENAPQTHFKIFEYLFANYLQKDGSFGRIKGIEAKQEVFHIGDVKTLDFVNNC
jgi:MurNAc alpha-1-phosphate uridylyltransferase